MRRVAVGVWRRRVVKGARRWARGRGAVGGGEEEEEEVVELRVVEEGGETAEGEEEGGRVASSVR